MKSDTEIRDDVIDGRVHARVQNGWVTLEGEVDYEFQRHEVEWMVRNVGGVIGITDIINVRRPAGPAKVVTVIEDAFRREAGVDSRHVRVDVSDHTARLYGQVHSLRAASAAESGRPRRQGWPRWRAIS